MALQNALANTGILYGTVVSDYPFTLSGFFKYNLLTNNPRPIYFDTDGSTPLAGIDFRGDISGDPVSARAGTTGFESFADSTSSYSSSNWNHAVGVFTSATNRTIYLDSGNSANNTDNRSLTGMNRTIALLTRAGGTLIGGEMAVWNVALSTSEIESLYKGFSCRRVRPQSLKFYLPGVRNIIELRQGLTVQNSPTITVADHPRVY